MEQRNVVIKLVVGGYNSIKKYQTTHKKRKKNEVRYEENISKYKGIVKENTVKRKKKTICYILKQVRKKI